MDVLKLDSSQKTIWANPLNYQNNKLDYSEPNLKKSIVLISSIRGECASYYFN